MQRRVRLGAAAALALLCSGSLQSESAPAFEVASVKLSEEPSRTPVRFGADSVTLTSVDLRIALILAYNVRDFQIVGPDWLRDINGAKRFNVTAKAAHAVPEEQLRLMLRALLSERFHLTMHWDRKSMPAVVLLPFKSGPKFHSSAAGIAIDSQWLGFPNVRHQATPGADGRLRHEFTNAPMAALAAAVSASMGADVDPVVDLTGLPGRYDFVLRDAPRPPAGEPAPSPEERIAVYKTIVQDELGLTLERRKAPIDMLIIDSADKVPTEN